MDRSTPAGSLGQPGAQQQGDSPAAHQQDCPSQEGLPEDKRGQLASLVLLFGKSGLMSLACTGGPRGDRESSTSFCLGEPCPTPAPGTGTWGPPAAPGDPSVPALPPDEDRRRSPRARPRRAIPNGLANRPTSIIISASLHAGTWGAARRWLRSLSRGHAPLQTTTSRTCSRARGHHRHPSHLMQHLFCRSVELARAGAAFCQRRPGPSPSLRSSAQVRL